MQCQSVNSFGDATSIYNGIFYLHVLHNTSVRSPQNYHTLKRPHVIIYIYYIWKTLPYIVINLYSSCKIFWPPIFFYKIFKLNIHINSLLNEMYSLFSIFKWIKHEYVIQSSLKKIIIVDQKSEFYTILHNSARKTPHLAKNDIRHTLSLEQQQHRVPTVALDWSAKNDICHCVRTSETTTTTQCYGGQCLLESCLLIIG